MISEAESWSVERRVNIKLSASTSSSTYAPKSSTAVCGVRTAVCSGCISYHCRQRGEGETKTWIQSSEIDIFWWRWGNLRFGQ